VTISNHERIGRGLELVRRALLPYAERELKAFYGQLWWHDGVENALKGNIGAEARGSTDEERFAALDAQALFFIMWDNWNQVFHAKLGHIGRTYISELREVRNKWAHQQAFTAEDAYRGLDTMQRLLEMVSASPEAASIQTSAREMMRQRLEEETKKEIKRSTEVVTETRTPSGLKPWREIATPHHDVAAGSYRQAEFAADLAQVVSGEAESEYKDPKEFFSRTYITEGLRHLLILGLNRLSKGEGEPVMELQTNFGGGKTHSMIALYHLVGGNLKPGEIAGFEEISSGAGVKDLPKASRAVLVGTKLNPAVGKTRPDGTTTRTMWGEMAYQLGGMEGYAMVAENDRTGTSPGSDTLKELFDRYSPALILIDEWVAHARQLYHVENLSAGSFEANMTFAQSLTEAAKRSPKTLVVASIPASDSEIGGEGGRAALDRIRNTFSRVEAVWRPASAEESFSIVRRRLFEPITDHTAKDAVCRAFAELYKSHRGEFPNECLEADYERRLRDAYPLHPELFDRLYQDWSTLERFHRTRGVLRLMAAVIHDLWDRQDKSLMIMPGNMPLDSSEVRFEITRNLPDGWGPVIDTDIDGPFSKPVSIDRENPTFGRFSASRRVSRTVFMGSAPSTAAQEVRGLEERRVKLGSVQPGETPATFGDSLRRLGEQLTYLFRNESRYWFDTRPSVNRLARDRAEDPLNNRVDDLDLEIVSRLRYKLKKGNFAAVHVAPSSSGEVSDEKEAKLVILGPGYTHAFKKGVRSAAQEQAEIILNKRGEGPRIYRNTLAFLAPDNERLAELKEAVAQLLAWKSIDRDKEGLNLNAFDRKQVETSVDRAEQATVIRVKETFIWLLLPTQDDPKISEITWNASKINASNGDSLPEKVSKRLEDDGQLIVAWSPVNLRIELDNLLWKDHSHIDVKTLWEYLNTYLYLPRLANESVFLSAVSEGLRSKDYFGYADKVEDGGRYLGLVYGTGRSSINRDGLSVLVRPEVAQRQLDEDERKKKGAKVVITQLKDTDGGTTTVINDKDDVPVDQPVTPLKPKLRRFHGTVNLDLSRPIPNAGQIVESVIQHLQPGKGTEVSVTIEIVAEIPEGADEKTIRTVSENCRVLKFTDFEFEER
jgi:hypothetical protein